MVENIVPIDIESDTNNNKFDTGNHIIICPNVVITNDMSPPPGIGGLVGATIDDFAEIVTAGSVVTKDVSVGMMVMGNPTRLWDLPKEMMSRG